jgi:hypothetical protein
MRALFLESEMEASSVSIWSGPAVTSTVVASAETSSLMLRRRSWRASSEMPLRLVVEKPGWATVTVYLPGLMFSKAKAPEASAVAERVKLWSTERRVTAAPGTVAPVASAAMPRMLPKVDWAWAAIAESAIRKAKRRDVRRTMCFMGVEPRWRSLMESERTASITAGWGVKSLRGLELRMRK